VTLGGVVLTVNGGRDEVERQLAGGELPCGGVLGRWRNGRLRPVRVMQGPDAKVVPRSVVTVRVTLGRPVAGWGEFGRPD
jgi:hypothetical protein